MPNNPVPPEETKPKTQRVARAVTQFSSRHVEIVAFASGTILGSVITLLAVVVG